jgi:purine-binding chemotaxis protein CheW
MKGLTRPTAPKPVDIAQMVAFHVGDGDYALDIMRIKEIINPLPVTPVPKAPPFIEGVVELRGAILPVVDLRKRFDLPATAPTRQSKVMIVGISISGNRLGTASAEPTPSSELRMIVGLVVDGVSEPIRVPREQLRAAPPLTQGANPYFSGMVRHQGKILMVLDLDAILSSTEKVSLAGLT